jgi:23S rRNA (uridine2552-2'-O)-methyltransferase
VSRKNKLSDRSARHDRFHQRARKEGFRARAIFKLQEIDDKLGVIPRGARVLDLGCAPGSWLQYARTVAGPDAVLVGVDRAPLTPEIPGMRMIVGDIHAIEPAALLGDLEAFDVVLSDMAPDTSGIKHLDQARSEALFERALDLAEATLAPGGNFVGKLFQGPDFKALTERCRLAFRKVKTVKPEGSRKQSIEQYVVALGYGDR